MRAIVIGLGLVSLIIASGTGDMFWVGVFAVLVSVGWIWGDMFKPTGDYEGTVVGSQVHIRQKTGCDSCGCLVMILFVIGLWIVGSVRNGSKTSSSGTTPPTSSP